MPAFGIVARAAGRPLALIDVGAGAGLNLRWDEFDYRYSNGSAFGTGMSPVQIDCEVRGPMPDIPERFPEVANRAGIDLHRSTLLMVSSTAGCRRFPMAATALPWRNPSALAWRPLSMTPRRTSSSL